MWTYFNEIPQKEKVSALLATAENRGGRANWTRSLRFLRNYSLALTVSLLRLKRNTRVEETLLLLREELHPTNTGLRFDGKKQLWTQLTRAMRNFSRYWALRWKTGNNPTFKLNSYLFSINCKKTQNEGKDYQEIIFLIDDLKPSLLTST